MELETVVIDDDSDVEMGEARAEKPPEKPAPITIRPQLKPLSALKIKEESDSDVEMVEAPTEKPPVQLENRELEELIEQFLELSGKDIFKPPDLPKRSRNRDASRVCMNKRCTSGKETKKAPAMIRELYCPKGSTLGYVCDDCLEEGFKLFMEMSKNLSDPEKSVFEVEVPELNDSYVVLDGDDEAEREETEEDKPLPREVIKMVKERLPEAFDQFMENIDFSKEKKVSHTLLNTLVKEFNDVSQEFKTNVKELQTGMVKCLDDLYHCFYPPAEVVEEIDIDDSKCDDKIIIPMNPEARRRSRMIKRQIATGIVGPHRTIIPTIYIPDDDEPPDTSVMQTESFPCSMNGPEYVMRLDWPSPKAGDKVYAMKISFYSEWAPAMVEDVKTRLIESNVKVTSYKVTVYGRDVYQKNVALGALAFFDPPPTNLVLKVGARVIARGSSRKKISHKFFSGMVAEVPCAANRDRYLIFYEDGVTEYVSKDEVRLVCEFRDDVASYFDKKSEPFIKNYLSKFPRRRMMKFDATVKFVRTESKGEWHQTRVAELDGALVKVFYVKTSNSEWIYRGSTRLYPVFEDTLKYLEGSSKTRNLRRRIPSETVSESAMYVVQQPPRAVARKSTAMFRSNEGLPIIPYKTAPVNDGNVKSLDFPMYKEKKFKPHDCCPKCLIGFKYSLEEAKKLSLLFVPLHYGFIRTIVEFFGYADNDPSENLREAFHKIDGTMELGVVYIGPCGRILRCIEEAHAYLSLTKCELSIDMFDFDFWVKVLHEYVVEEKHIKIPDLSYGRENIPIPCVNSIDNLVPCFMDYRTERRGRDGVYLNTDLEFLTCCDCTDDCSDKMKCSCWQKTIQGYKALGKVNKSDPLSIGYQFRRLQEVVPTGIYECNQRCKCRKNCFNRVVQNPLQHKLQLFKTRRKGWGIRCLNDIPAGSFVCVYMGDILTESHANEEGRRYGDEYFAELDYIEVVEALKEDYEDQVVGVDMDDDVNSDCGDTDFNLATNLDSDDDYDLHDLSDLSQGTRMKLRERKKKKKLLKEPSKEEEVEEGSPAARAREEEERDRINVKTYNDVRPSQIFQPPSIADEADPEDSQESDVEKNSKNPSASNRHRNPYEEPEEFKSVREYYGPDETVYIMDAKYVGNIGRYLNHSCDPNIFVQNVFVDTHDLRFPWVAFFALRHIKAGSELTWDYRYEVGSVPGKKLYCYCESSECRGRLL